MRSPFDSEPDALDFLLLFTLSLLPIAISAVVAPTWLTLAVIALVATALTVRGFRLHAARRENPARELKTAPPHLGPAGERRVLLVANDTLNNGLVIREAQSIAAAPDARLMVLAPAIVSSSARLTGDIDRAREQARGRLQQALERIPAHEGKVSDDPPLEAIEDAVATFAPDQILISTRSEHSSNGLDPNLASVVRRRFALPVDELNV